ncbi:MAG TPA: hypothetical protein VGK20_10435 [Candidatus Binatia bacterium]|jgi:hypothetical protein
MSMRHAIAIAAAAALMITGCTFDWGSGGISDVKVAGRTVGTPTATNADNGEDAAAAAEKAKEKAKQEEKAKASLRRIAILPAAYNDASGGRPCDLCPPDVKMKPTSLHSARLATGFVYEAIARHPRLLFPTPETVDRTTAQTTSHGMRETGAKLAAAGQADYLVVSALIELRERVGSDDAPTSPAGVSLYVALVNAHTGETIWSDTFDRNESYDNFVTRSYDKIANDKPVRYSTADGYTEHAVDKMIGKLVKKID